MQINSIKKLISTFEAVIILLNVPAFISPNSFSQSNSQNLTVNSFDFALLKICESENIRTAQQRTEVNNINEIYFSYDFFTDNFIKSWKILEINYTSYSESNIRLSTFFISQTSTST